ncbi:MAG: hypothetical protein M3Q24_02555 [bacterium]|nr:hypothetical protein [bacterium]
MNKESGFPAENPENEAKIIEGLINGDVTSAGGSYVESKSLEDNTGWVDKEPDDNFLPKSEWRDENSNNWEKRHEGVVLKHIGKVGLTKMVFEILENKYPNLGVRIIDEAINYKGAMSQDVATVMFRGMEKGAKIINSILANPIIELILSPHGSRFIFDSNYARVASARSLTNTELLKIKAKYLNDVLSETSSSSAGSNDRFEQKELKNLDHDPMSDTEIEAIFEKEIKSEIALHDLK